MSKNRAQEINFHHRTKNLKALKIVVLQSREQRDERQYRL